MAICVVSFRSPYIVEIKYRTTSVRLKHREVWTLPCAPLFNLLIQPIMYQPNLYNERISDLVSQCHKDIVEMFRDNGIEKILFSQHENVLSNGIPYAVFECEGLKHLFSDVREVCLGNGVLFFIGKKKYCAGYTDGYYGDYFDVAQSLPRIYAAICDVINAGDIKENERI